MGIQYVLTDINQEIIYDKTDHPKIRKKKLPKKLKTKFFTWFWSFYFVGSKSFRRARTPSADSIWFYVSEIISLAGIFFILIAKAIYKNVCDF